MEPYSADVWTAGYKFVLSLRVEVVVSLSMMPMVREVTPDCSDAVKFAFGVVEVTSTTGGVGGAGLTVA